MTKRADHNTFDDDNDLPPHPYDPSRDRAKLAKGVLRGVVADFGRHRGRIFPKLRKQRQQDYIKLIVALLPKEFRVKDVDLSVLTDEEFTMLLNATREAVAEQKKKQGGGGGATGSESGGAGH